MTSDAKIGLLLGLVFIFIIAIIVNGLPTFHKAKTTNELTKNVVSIPNGTPAIAAKERKASREVFEPAVRYTRPLPQDLNIAQDVQQRAENAEPPRSAKIVKEQENSDAQQLSKTQSPQRPRTYIVAEGDSLASIAQRFYGPIEGNRKVNVDRIFAANQQIVKSPDELYPGQKLIIPPLMSALSAKNGGSQILNSPLLETVTSVGRRHPAAGSDSKEKSSLYTVAEGDNLWKIAAEKLGDGNRYAEIVKLNSDIIQDEDYLEVGMRLRLPTK